MPPFAPPPTVTVADDISRALADGRPVAALESTIFTHGLPQPHNLQTAHEAEQLLRSAGVLPATIGVVRGTPTVGLSDGERELLCTDSEVGKLSVRDLPVAAAQGRNGGTTVAATALLAHHAGIQVFVTGGLGGVHHGAGTSFDESADLPTLAATPVLVVSAGVKSVLDIPATLERLETLNIPVVGYRTTRFPGFYVADSGHAVPHTVQTAVEAASVATARDGLGLSSAVLVANPVPEERQLDPVEHRRVLTEAWQDAARNEVTGSAVTPFLLDHIQRATGGRSLQVNLDAYRNNIAVGADIARALAG